MATNDVMEIRVRILLGSKEGGPKWRLLSPHPAESFQKQRPGVSQLSETSLDYGQAGHWLRGAWALHGHCVDTA